MTLGSHLPDAELVVRVQNGDRQWFDTLVDRHFPLLVGLLRARGAPAPVAEDVAQESFLKAFLNIRQFDPKNKFFNFVAAIAKNALIDLVRRRRVEERVLLAIPPAELPDPESEAVKRVAMQDFLATLNEETRFLIEARVFKGLSFADLAELTGETENALRVKVHRALAKLTGPTAKEADHEPVR